MRDYSAVLGAGKFGQGEEHGKGDYFADHRASGGVSPLAQDVKERCQHGMHWYGSSQIHGRGYLGR